MYYINICAKKITNFIGRQASRQARCYRRQGKGPCLFRKDVKKAFQRDDVRAKTFRISRGLPDGQEMGRYFQQRE